MLPNYLKKFFGALLILLQAKILESYLTKSITTKNDSSPPLRNGLLKVKNSIPNYEFFNFDKDKDSLDDKVKSDNNLDNLDFIIKKIVKREDLNFNQTSNDEVPLPSLSGRMYYIKFFTRILYSIVCVGKLCII